MKPILYPYMAKGGNVWVESRRTEPFTDPSPHTAIAARHLFHIVGNASEKVCKRANSMYVYGRSQLLPYTLHGVNQRLTIQVWVQHAIGAQCPRSGLRVR